MVTREKVLNWVLTETQALERVTAKGNEISQDFIFLYLGQTEILQKLAKDLRDGKLD